MQKLPLELQNLIYRFKSGPISDPSGFVTEGIFPELLNGITILLSKSLGLWFCSIKQQHGYFDSDEELAGALHYFSRDESYVQYPRCAQHEFLKHVRGSLNLFRYILDIKNPNFVFRNGKESETKNSFPGAAIPISEVLTPKAWSFIVEAIPRVNLRNTWAQTTEFSDKSLEILKAYKLTCQHLQWFENPNGPDYLLRTSRYKNKIRFEKLIFEYYLEDLRKVVCQASALQ
jgi:hypothetical protein